MVAGGLLRELAGRLGAEVRGARPVAGGDVNEAWRVDLADGRRLFVKANADAPAGMFEAEAHGLCWLAAGGALRVPGVVAVAERWLALEWIEPGRPAPDTDERLGRGLARLHRSGASEPGFVLDRDNFIGTLPQDNRRAADWPTFWAERRLLPQARAAVRRGLLDRGTVRAIERIAADLSARLGPPEPPARLHGDLWGGNRMTAAGGEPVLVDPAATAGHREVDLAMMTLFGGFSERVFAAYREEWPLAPGWRDRLPHYQLYYLLVHVNLFGAGWSGRVAAVVRALA